MEAGSEVQERHMTVTQVPRVLSPAPRSSLPITCIPHTGTCTVPQYSSPQMHSSHPWLRLKSVFKGTAGGSAHWFGVSGIRRLEPGYSSSLPFHLDLSEGEL